MTTIIKSNIAADPNLPKFRRAEILNSDVNNGARCLFALNYPWCFDGTVADAETIRNLAYNAEGSYDMLLKVTAGQTVTHVGGGLDFSAMTDGEAYIQGNAGSLSSIAAGDQHFLVVAWQKLPSQADWNNEATLLPLFCTTADDADYSTAADMLTISQHNSGALQARRQTDGGPAVDTLSITPDATLWGEICQITYWRTATETGFRIKSKFGEKSVTAASGAVNSGDFSAGLPKWGVPGSFTNLIGLQGHRDGTNAALYRGLVEDLQVSGRAPLTVADADWKFVLKSGIL